MEKEERKKELKIEENNNFDIPKSTTLGKIARELEKKEEKRVKKMIML